ncbi:hypothetical protein Q7P35_008974 [Cladosporium inversicolor]
MTLVLTKPFSSCDEIVDDVFTRVSMRLVYGCNRLLETTWMERNPTGTDRFMAIECHPSSRKNRGGYKVRMMCQPDSTSIIKLLSIMRSIPGTTAMSLVLTSIYCVQAQRPDSAESLSEEARFPISRGDNFTFQPAAGSLCQWAVAQYSLSEKQFFILDSQPACTPAEGNVSTTLRLQFGDEVAPGNATLTVQCKEPSVWNFIINDDAPERGRKTVLDSVCHPGEIPSGKNGFGGGWQNGSNSVDQGGSAGINSPSGSSSLPGQPGNWSHGLPTSLSAPSSAFVDGFSQISSPASSSGSSPASDLASNPASNLASNPASKQVSDPVSTQASGQAPSQVTNPPTMLTSARAFGVDTDIVDTDYKIPTSLISGQSGLQTDGMSKPFATSAPNPASGSELDLPPEQASRGPFGTIPVMTDSLSTLQPTMSSLGEAAEGDKSPSTTKQPFEPIFGPMSSIIADDSQPLVTSALSSSCWLCPMAPNRDLEESLLMSLGWLHS